MTPNELYGAGRLSEAIAQLTEEIKADPGNQRSRVFLFELLCFAGDLTRAARQLDALTASEADAEIAVARYRYLLEAESARRGVFSGSSSPHVPNPVPAYLAQHLEAMKSIGVRNMDRAITLLEGTQDILPTLRVDINGKRYEDVGDADDVLRPFLEAVVEGVYCWIPWETVQSLSIVPAKYLRDLCWAPAHLELLSGKPGETFLPVLYAGSYLHQDDRVRLGRMTEWRPDCPGLSIGVGQRLLAAGDEEIPMLDITEMEFDHAEPGDSAR